MIMLKAYDLCRVNVSIATLLTREEGNACYGIMLTA